MIAELREQGEQAAQSPAEISAHTERHCLVQGEIALNPLNEWWFSIIVFVEALTGSNIPKRYWSDLKRKLLKEGYSELYDKIVQLKFAAADGGKFNLKRSKKMPNISKSSGHVGTETAFEDLCQSFRFS
jgi:hypothetical protein